MTAVRDTIPPPDERLNQDLRVRRRQPFPDVRDEPRFSAWIAERAPLRNR